MISGVAWLMSDLELFQVAVDALPVLQQCHVGVLRAEDLAEFFQGLGPGLFSFVVAPGMAQGDREVSLAGQVSGCRGPSFRSWATSDVPAALPA